MKKIALLTFVALLFLVGVTVATTSNAHADDMGTSIVWTDDGASQ